MPPHYGYVKECASSSYTDEPRGEQPQADVKRTRPPERVGASLQERRSAELRRHRRSRRAQTIADMHAPRVWLEMFEQTARDLDAEDYVDRLFERFAGLDPEMLRALGADKIPHLPIRAMPR
jgi:hypothetical protein